MPKWIQSSVNKMEKKGTVGSLTKTAKASGGYDAIHGRIKKQWLEAHSKDVGTTAKRSRWALAVRRGGGPIDVDTLIEGIVKLKPDIDKTYARVLAHNVSQAAYDNNVDPYSLIGQMYQESRFNPKAVSHRGATGVAQFMEGTAQKYGLEDRTDPVASIHAMAQYMSDTINKNVNDKLPDTIAMAQMRYNAGGPSLKKWLKEGRLPKETNQYPQLIKEHTTKAFGKTEEPDYLYTAGIDENDPLVDKYAATAKRMRAGGGLTAEKAAKILHDGTVYGKPISEKQRKFFGAIANKQQGGYIEYDAPSHEQGGGMVDRMGNPTNDPAMAAAEIEKQESAVKNGPMGKPYVFSDTLINPITGNTIATDATRMENKMQGNDDISMTGRRLHRAIMINTNEQQRKYQYGGKFKMRPGGLLEGEPDPGQPNYEERLAAFRHLRDNLGASLPEDRPYDNPVEIMDMLPTMEPKPISEGMPLEPGNTASVMSKYASNPLKYVLSKDGKPLINNDTKDGAPKGAEGFTDVTQAGTDLLPNIGGIDAGSLMKVGSGILSGIMALQPAEKEKMQMPDYSSGDKLYANLGIDTQALKNEILATSNAARKEAMGGSGSFGQYLNRVRSISSATGRELAGQELAGKQYNDQMAITRGGREDMKAITEQQEKIRTQTADSQNTAMRQDMIQNLLNQTDRFGTEMMANRVLEETTKNMNDNQRKQMVIDMASMESKYPDFKMSDEVKMLIADPDATWEQLRDALSKDLVQWRGTRIGEITPPATN